MSLLRAATECFCTLWILGLGLAFIVGAPGPYVRTTKAWLFRSLRWVLRTAMQLVSAIVGAIARWISHHARNW